MVKSATENHWRPLKYRISVSPCLDESYFSHTDVYQIFKSYIDQRRVEHNFIFFGKSKITFKVDAKTNNITLKIFNLEIHEAATKLTIIDTTYKTYIPTMYTYDNKRQTVVFQFANNLLPSNTYELIVNFIGTIKNTGSFYWKSRYLNDKVNDKVWLIAATDFHETGIQLWFPYCDKLDTKTDFEISVQYNGYYQLLSNTNIQNTVFAHSTKTVYHERAVNIFPYSVAIIFHDLAKIFNDTDTFDKKRTVVIWGRKKVARQLEFTKWTIRSSRSYLQANVFKTEFLPNMNIIVIPDFQDNYIEGWGFLYCSETAVIYDEILHPIGHKMHVAFTIARRIANQFFNNMIGEFRGSYHWINEGIATFLGIKIVNQVLSVIDSNMLYLFAVQFQQECLRLNNYYDMPLVSKVNESFNFNSLFPFIHQIKAPVIIHMLSEIMPSNVFMSSLLNYINFSQARSASFDISNSTSNNSTFNFFDFMQPVLTNMSEKEEINIEKKMNSWITLKRYPVLEVTREFGNEVTIKLSQKYLNESYSKNLWIPVGYIIQFVTDNSFMAWLNPYNQSIQVPYVNQNRWIIVNAEQSGYYRVKYDNKSWENILNCLNSMQFNSIDFISRAQLIDDAYHFLLTGELDFVIFEKLTSYLIRETNYIPWYSVIKIMEDISGFFAFSQSNIIKAHFQIIFDAVLRNITYTESENDSILTKYLRQEAAKWACIINSYVCKDIATLTLIQHLVEKESVKPKCFIMSWWKEWTYCQGLKKANDTIWNRVIQFRKDDEEILKYLTYHIIIMQSIIAKHAKNNLILDYTLQHFQRIIPRGINEIAVLIDIINHVYSERQLSMVSKFANTYFLSKSSPYISQKIQTRLSEIKKQTNYFENLLQIKDVYYV
ncbi:hypothetical protein P5V15_001625 [Pogonomyrmex californicus]